LRVRLRIRLSALCDDRVLIILVVANSYDRLKCVFLRAYLTFPFQSREKPPDTLRLPAPCFRDVPKRVRKLSAL
jgi:hypothetical protein